MSVHHGLQDGWLKVELNRSIGLQLGGWSVRVLAAPYQLRTTLSAQRRPAEERGGVSHAGQVRKCRGRTGDRWDPGLSGNWCSRFSARTLLYASARRVKSSTWGPAVLER